METDAPFSSRARASALAAISAEPVDLLVIGGGITGAGIARDAALRGIRTVLVDKGDFGSATSSHSSRLVHGGLRYLEQYQWRLVFEAAHERRVLLTIAPHLVHPLPFLFPVYRGARVPGWKLRAGMWLYDLLGGWGSPRHRWLGRKRVARLEPRLRAKNLRGAGLYFDAQTDDARLVLAIARSAAQAGAVAVNYAEVTSLLKSEGRVRGATVRDVIGGREYTIPAAVVVNATGPWVDQLRQRDDARAAPLLRLTKGAHVAVRRARLGHTHAVTFTSPIDGRVMFVLPWGDLSYVGTTDTEDSVSPDDLRATGADVVYLLRSVNALFPDARLTPRDVLATWAGLRALLAPPRERELAPSQVSREHRVVEAPSGLITIAGGKLTTFRIMARDLVDHVSRRLRTVDGRPLAPRPATDRMALAGGESPNLEALSAALHSRGIPEVQAAHLVRYYGSEAAALGNLVDRDHALGDAIIPGRPEIWAEIVHAVDREMAVRLTDMMIRRLHLFYEDSAQGLGAAPAIAARMAALLGWDDARRAAEIDAYQREVARSRAFLDEVPRVSGPVT